MLNGPEQAAFLGLVWNHGRAGVATTEQGLARIDPQSAPLVLRTVAFLTIGDEEGADS